MPIVEFAYIVCAALLALYGGAALIYTVLYWEGSRTRQRTEVPTDGSDAAGRGELPYVTIQLPIFNERYVAVRLLEAVLRLDWPDSRLQIQMLDDSTDDTSELIAGALSRGVGRQCEVTHIRRSDRRGYKAGALQAGLAQAKGEFIAFFDADFVPPADFLWKTMGNFDDAAVGCVQTRWGHLNEDTSLLTVTQALGIDGHFVVEQSVRSHVRAFLNFNGTAGIWRKSCIEDAGGWQGDTLTEDLDLSYRAQLAGWRIVYDGSVVVPAELPVQIAAFKRQQFRWAKGSIQTAIKLLVPLWRSRNPFWRKTLGVLHLTNYAVHPLMLLNLLLLLPVATSQSRLLAVTPFLALAAIGPPSIYWTVLTRHPAGLWRRLGRLALLLALGFGVSLNNSRAVLEAAIGRKSEFSRTPKFAAAEGGHTWHGSRYAIGRAPIIWFELALAGYAGGLLIFAVAHQIWWVALWLVFYAAGYGYVALLGLVQERQVRQSRRRADRTAKPATVVERRPMVRQPVSEIGQKAVPEP